MAHPHPISHYTYIAYYDYRSFVSMDADNEFVKTLD